MGSRWLRRSRGSRPGLTRGAETVATALPWPATGAPAALGALAVVARAALPPEPARSMLIRPDRPQEVDTPESWPVRVAEVVLAVHALPWQEARQPDLA